MRRKVSSRMKAILPRKFVNWIRNRNRRKRFEGLSSQDTFDAIYRDGFWGKDADGNPLSGTGSHKRDVVDPYVQVLQNILQREGSPSVVDLGCGDFNVGRQLVGCTSNYLACDISPTIIALNKERFADLNAEFRQFDLAGSDLPPADFCLVRQVLQHLCNADIQYFVSKLQSDKPYRYLVVTEHVSLQAQDRPNIDKPTGPGIRVEKKSGVDLAEAPFNLAFVERSEILSIAQDNDLVKARIVTTLYRLKE